MKKQNSIDIPADVPSHAAQEYLNNYQAITGPSNRLFLFAADQKIEHLNEDFYGTKIPTDVRHVKHLFEIAQKGKIGAIATHLGLIARYGNQYPSINYIVKLNAKTNLIPPKQRDPISQELWSVHDVVTMKEQSNLNIRGIGFSIYLGSEFEHEMLAQAAEAIFNAHQHGLITILWAYLRGKVIKDDQDPILISGAAGVAPSLGADFVKIKPPHATKALNNSDALKLVCDAAGNTKVICAGQAKDEPHHFLQTVYDQLKAGSSGCAIGRNIFQRSTIEAIAITEALSALIHDNASVEKAFEYYRKTSSIK
jgi:fructose-bisphosphate aldolase/6-deoxy-5-ketofructose 1-phosphate synthase